MPSVADLLAAALAAMRADAEAQPSREKSLAITHLETACLWWQDHAAGSASVLDWYRSGGSK